MESTGHTYTISELAGVSGVSVRTLRHYEEVGLLLPLRDARGYRIYTEDDARRLADILGMRRCGLGLPTIRTICASDNAKTTELLKAHLAHLRMRQEALVDEMRRTSAAIATCEEMGHMSTKEAFERLKREAIDKNERVFGAEARERHGDDAIDAANEHLQALDEKSWDDMVALEHAIIAQLRRALATGDAAGADARELCRLHERWLRLRWPEGAYSKDAHLGLAEGYLRDERFRTYYDTRAGVGATDFLVCALRDYLRA